MVPEDEFTDDETSSTGADSASEIMSPPTERHVSRRDVDETLAMASKIVSETASGHSTLRHSASDSATIHRTGEDESVHIPIGEQHQTRPSPSVLSASAADPSRT